MTWCVDRSDPGRCSFLFPWKKKLNANRSVKSLPPDCELGRDVPKLLVPGLRDAGEDKEQGENAGGGGEPDHAVGEEGLFHHGKDHLGDQGGGGGHGDGEA